MEQETNPNILKLGQEYIQLICKANEERNSSSKFFYIILKNSNLIKNNIPPKNEIIEQELNEKYFKVKECLARCGNIVVALNEREEVITFLTSFFGNKQNEQNEVMV